MEIIIGILAFLGGGIGAWVITQTALKSRATKIVKEAEVEAEVIRKEKNLQAKEKFLQLKSDFERDFNDRNSKLLANENRIKQKELAANQRAEELKKRREI